MDLTIFFHPKSLFLSRRRSALAFEGFPLFLLDGPVIFGRCTFLFGVCRTFWLGTLVVIRDNGFWM